MATPAVAASTVSALECRLHLPEQVRAGAPVPLRFELFNRGQSRLRLLRWNTPLEGWFGRFLRVTFGGREVPYQGPQVKRAQPAAEDYLILGPGKHVRATVDLLQVYAMTQPGSYQVVFDGWLHDVTTGTPSAATQNPHSLDCLPASVKVVAAR